MAKRKSSSEPGSLGPMTIHVKKKRSPAWTYWDQVERRQTLLADCGFFSIGYYGVKEMPGVTMWVLGHESEPFFAIITEYPTVGVWAEINVQYANGDSLTVTNAEFCGLLDQMPGQQKIVMTDSDEKTLFGCAKKNLKRGEVIRVTAKNFVSIFEDTYAREMQWRTNKGISEQEVRRVATAGGDYCDKETIRTTVKIINRDHTLACSGGESCPYQEQGMFSPMMESMPIVPEDDQRRCPSTGRLCIEFASAEDLESVELPDPISVENMTAVYTLNPIKPINVCRETGEMKAAISKSQKSLGVFIKRFQNSLKEDRDFMLRLRVKRKDACEYLWVKPVTLERKRFVGETLYESAIVPSIHTGDTITFTSDQVTDWIYFTGNQFHGYLTGMVLLKRMDQESERLLIAAEKENGKMIRKMERLMSKQEKGSRSS